MYDAGYHNIVNIDVRGFFFVKSPLLVSHTHQPPYHLLPLPLFIRHVQYSTTLIAQMQQKHAESRPNMTWLDMDIRHLEFNDDEFDVVLDKGTMDAMLTSKGDVWVCVFFAFFSLGSHSGPC